MINRVQGTSGSPVATGGVTSFSVTYTSAVTAGNILVASIGTYAGGTITVADSINATNFALLGSVGTTTYRALIYWLKAAAGGSSMAVTLGSSSTTYPSMCIAEYSFPAGATVSVDGAPQTDSGGTSPASTPSLTCAGNDLCLAAICPAGLCTPTGSNGFSVGNFTGFSNANYEEVTDLYLLNQAAGSVTPAASLSPSTSWFMVAGSLNYTVPAVVVPVRLLMGGFKFSNMDTP